MADTTVTAPSVRPCKIVNHSVTPVCAPTVREPDSVPTAEKSVAKSNTVLLPNVCGPVKVWAPNVWPVANSLLNPNDLPAGNVIVPAVKLWPSPDNSVPNTVPAPNDMLGLPKSRSNDPIVKSWPAKKDIPAAKVWSPLNDIVPENACPAG